MRLVFCGTPEIAVPTLRRLLATPDHSVVGVITQPERPRGRERERAESPVKIAARAAGLEVFQPGKIRLPEVQAWLEAKAPDAAVLIAYGQILPARLLSIPRLGWINLHASLLPRYRGAAPIPWSIARGETRTGITTMQIDAGMDTGPILLQREIEIGADETTPELSARMGEAGAPLILETLEGLARGTLVPRPQESAQASSAPMLKREDGRIRWEWSAAEIYNRMRGFSPWPGTFAEFRGKRVHLWGRPAALELPEEGAGIVETYPKPTQLPLDDTPPSRIVALVRPGFIFPVKNSLFVCCGSSTWLEVTEVQPEGRRRMTAREFERGAHLLLREQFE